MKIVCDSCSAKYSIADEKVAGRVFKIRCKKCGAAIVVRGDQVDTPEEEPSTRVVDYGGDAVWHIVIEGDQQGPYAPSQIGEMLSAGTIGWDAFVWREGFDDWKPAQDIEELVSAVMGDGGGEEASASSEGAEMGADPFAAAPEAAEPAAPAAAPAEPAGGDLFGGAGRDEGADLFAGTADSSPFGGGEEDEEDDLVASAPGPRVSADQALTGARNENSVLFSLSNLQALATGSSESSAPSSPAPAMGSPRPGMAAGEGSGLIDIRALASATGMTMGNEGPITSANDDRVDDLLSIGGGGGLGSSLGAPVLIPEQKEESSNKGLIIGIAVAGVAVVAAAAVVMVVLLKDDPVPVAPAGALGPVQSGETTGAVAAPDPAPTAAETPTETPEAAATPTETAEAEPAGGGDEEPEAGGGDEAPAATGGRRRRRRAAAGGGGGGSTASPPASTGGGSTASSGRRRGGGGDSIDSLLDDALSGGGGGGGGRSRSGSSGSSGSSGGGGSGPQTPTRGSVVSAMRSVQGAVRACGNGAHGLAPVRMVFSGSTGRITSANVSGGNFPGPVRSCIARAARGARVPPFRQASFSVNYPFNL